jgi:drug/metabolite transporter (DMT)-like permease
MIGDLPMQSFGILLGKSVLGGVGFLLVMSALKEGEISGVLPLLGLTPAVTAILSLLLTGEALTASEWMGVGIMTAGAIVVEAGSLPPAGWKNIVLTRNHAYVAGALLVFGLSSVADRVLVGGQMVDLRIVLVYQHLVYFLLFGSVLLVGGASFPAILSKSREPLPLLLLIAAVTIGSRFAQLEATSLAPVALVLAVKRTSILYASLFGGKIFLEKRLPLRIAGTLLIIAAGFIILRNAG